MKRHLLILIALAISSPCFASAAGVVVPVRYVAIWCDPSDGHFRAGNEMTQGLTGYERQVQRVLEPVTENTFVRLTSKIR